MVNISGMPGLLAKMLQQVVKPQETPAIGDGSRPHMLVARVLGRQGDLALLRWQGQEILARLDAAVTPGETLLLQLKQVKEGRYYYRILSRSAGRERLSERGAAGDREQVHYSIFNPGTHHEDCSPVLVRYHPPPPKGKSSPQNTVLLELFVETSHLGLIMIQAGRRGEGFFCQLLVESEETGKLLEDEARRLTRDGPDAVESLSWRVVELREMAASVIRQGGYSLDHKA